VRKSRISYTDEEEEDRQIDGQTDNATNIMLYHKNVTGQASKMLDLARGTLFRSSCAIQTSATDCSDDS